MVYLLDNDKREARGFVEAFLYGGIGLGADAPHVLPGGGWCEGPAAIPKRLSVWDSGLAPIAQSFRQYVTDRLASAWEGDLWRQGEPDRGRKSAATEAGDLQGRGAERGECPANGANFEGLSLSPTPRIRCSSRRSWSYTTASKAAKVPIGSRFCAGIVNECFSQDSRFQKSLKEGANALHIACCASRAQLSKSS